MNMMMMIEITANYTFFSVMWLIQDVTLNNKTLNKPPGLDSPSARTWWLIVLCSFLACLTTLLAAEKNEA